MSPVGQALRDRFEAVCRSELQRLRKKTASLPEAERAQVDALALEVTRSLAVTLDAAVAASGRSGIAPVVMRLFAVTCANGTERPGEAGASGVTPSEAAERSRL